jgi:hypothetical protein
MNKIDVEINNQVVEKDTFINLLKYCVPRPEKKLLIITRPRTPWTFPKSIWAMYDYQYEGETEVSNYL